DVRECRRGDGGDVVLRGFGHGDSFPCSVRPPDERGALWEGSSQVCRSPEPMGSSHRNHGEHYYAGRTCERPGGRNQPRGARKMRPNVRVITPAGPTVNNRKTASVPRAGTENRASGKRTHAGLEERGAAHSSA